MPLRDPEGAPAALYDRIARGRAAVLDRLVLAVRPVTDRSGADHDVELTARILSAVSDEYARHILTDPDTFPPHRLLEHARWWIGTGALVEPGVPGRSSLRHLGHSNVKARLDDLHI